MSKIEGLISEHYTAVDSRIPRTAAMTVRVDEYDKLILEAICQFLGVSHQRFLYGAVQDAIALARDSIAESGDDRSEALIRDLLQLESVADSDY
jgi:hypothetical protein